MLSKNVLVICPDRQLMGALLPLLSQHLPMAPVLEESVYIDRRKTAEILKSSPPWLVFLDMISDRARGMTILNDINTAAKGVLVVALLPGNDSDLILTCLRQGATEFLLRPLSAEQVQEVLDRIMAQSAARGSGARVMCVLPVKGACGASTLACNLALQWKRHGAERTLLADMDPAAGTVSFLLKLKSTYSFLDAVSRYDMDSDIWRGIVSHYQSIDVLLSPENSGDQNIHLPDPTPVMSFCRQAYDAVTIDMASAFGPWNLALANHADDLLLVSTNELPALRATQRVLQYLEHHGVDREKMKLVVNRYSTDAGLNRDAIEAALGAGIYHTVTSDYESVQRALVEGRPIPPSSTFGKSLGALADKLGTVFHKEDPAAAKGKKKAGSGWTSIFGSLLGGSKKAK